MLSQLREWINGSRFSGRPAVFSFTAVSRTIQNFTENYRSGIKRLTCGVMFGSSAVLPSLYPAALNLRGLYELAFGIAVCSAILFVLLNGAEIALNVKYTLAGAVIVGILVLLSQRTSPEAFAPYIPILVALSLLVTIYIVPWLRTYIQHRNTFTLRDYVIATHDNHSRGSYGAVVDPSSVRSTNIFRGDLSRDLELGTFPLEFEHMDHLGEAYRMQGLQGPNNASSVDLHSGHHQEDETSTSSADSRDPCL